MRITPGSNPLPPPAAPAPQAPAGTPEPNVIEADVGLQLTPGGRLAGNGSLVMSRVFIERLIRRVTQNRQAIKDVKMAYDPAVGAYAGSAKVTLKGMTFDMVMRGRPTVNGNQPGIQFDDIGLELGGMVIRNPLLTRFATRKIAEEISKSSIIATAEKNVVRLEPTSVLHKIKALPDFLQIDGVDTTLTAQMGANGDVSFQARNTDGPAARPETAQSDLSLTTDAENLKDTLGPLLLPAYELERLTFGHGTVTLEGKAEARVVSDVVNAGKLISSLIMLAGGYPPGDMRGGRAMVPLKLTAQISGTTAVLTPSIRQALPEVEKMLTKLNAKPRRVGESLEFDLKALSGRLGVQQVTVTPEGLKAKARMDIPGQIKSPVLRGETNA